MLSNTVISRRHMQWCGQTVSLTAVPDIHSGQLRYGSKHRIGIPIAAAQGMIVMEGGQ
ncbi:hypothetical protein [Pseudopontixanthobacter vadosimaris]|uniref:hypothetical protein n=1 Tax=Pseudopontixanthobacter vadosimaris TaxID=2726450 RepID=UPI001475A431|nr:hypothetical protein [Pseudopontixanthobacter vadosimaris]